MSERVGAGGKPLTETDRRMINLCLSCTRPPEACDTSHRCPYKRQYGDSAPKTLIQDRCGVRGGADTIDVMEMRRKGTKVERDLGINPARDLGFGKRRK